MGDSMWQLPRRPRLKWNSRGANCSHRPWKLLNGFLLPVAIIHIFSVPVPFPHFLHVMPKTKVDIPTVRRRTLSDPLAAALLPPPDESPVEREVRLRAAIDAKKVSDSIDDMIRMERNERKKSKAEINVLLLGQSESGKSTTLKRELPVSCYFFGFGCRTPIAFVDKTFFSLVESCFSLYLSMK